MFLLHEITHIVLSLVVAWFFYRYAKNIWVYIVSFLGGFFLDADHLFDYFKFKGGFAFNFQEFISSAYFDAVHKVFLLFHGYEYALILSIIAIVLLSIKSIAWKSKQVFAFCLLAFSISTFLHLVYDQLSYKPKPLTYSIIYRSSLNFDHDSLGFRAHYEK